MSYKRILAKSFASWCRLLKRLGIGPEPISEVYAGRLFLGSIVAASDLDLLQREGITHVVTVTTFGDAACFFPHHIKYHAIQIMDLPVERIYDHLEPALHFINEAFLTSSSRVLVHCVEGRSRSATIVLAYLMDTNNWSVDQALCFLRLKRPCVHPNSGFVDELRRLCL